MSLIQDGGEEVEEDAVYHVTLKRVQIQQAASKGARWLGIERDQLPPDHTVSQHETCKIRSIKAGTLEKLVENLLTAFGDNDFNYINIFLSTYRGFATTKEVLELILDRYGNLEISNCEDDRSQNSTENKTVLRTAIASILRAWLDQCSEDFREPPDYLCLQKLLAYLTRVMPGSVLEGRAQNLLEQFQKQEVMNGGIHDTLANEEKLETENSEDFSSFAEDFVAEQLTYMDAELFKRLVPYHCLGSIWSQRSKKENNHLALTIRATIAQFNAVTQCVIRTILNDKELKTQQRAKIIEKWIDIAHECRILKNFSSLRAIVSALQSNSIYRLKKCWASVAKDSMLMFEELSEIFSDRDNYLISRELLMREGTSKFANLDSSVKENQKRTQRRLQLQKDMGIMQGTVPYLGTFLTDLTMLDAALQNYVEGGLINFEKRRREFEVIAQIKLLQSSCNSYCMTSDRRFIQWFRKQPELTEEESYALACEIEAAADTTTTSPNSRKSMVKRLSLLFQGSDVISNTTPTKEQPSGSSGESMASDSVSPCESPDGPQKNLSESSSPSSSNHSMDTSSSGVSSFTLSPPLPLDSNPAIHPLSISNTSALWLPYYNQKSEESCIIRVHLEPSNGNMYKSILVTNQDKAPAVMQRALLKHNLDPVAVEEYDLVQVISQKKELLIPFDANVFYAINSQANFDFIMRRKFDMFKMTLPKKRGWWRRRR